MYVCIYIQAHKKIDYLQSELDEKKQLVEQFQEAAEKAKQRENLSEEHTSREIIEKDSSTSVAKLKDKLSCCNLELKKKLERINPNYEVGC